MVLSTRKKNLKKILKKNLISMSLPTALLFKNRLDTDMNDNK